MHHFALNESFLRLAMIGIELENMLFYTQKIFYCVNIFSQYNVIIIKPSLVALKKIKIYFITKFIIYKFIAVCENAPYTHVYVCFDKCFLFFVRC